MTMIAAACALVDNFVDSGSFLRTEVSACDYGIMDSAAACCVVLRPSVSTFQQPYGYAAHATWGFGVEAYIRDDGDVVNTLTKAIQMHDVLYDAVAGSIANTATMTAHVTSIRHNPLDSWFSPGGNSFLLVTAETQVEES